MVFISLWPEYLINEVGEKENASLETKLVVYVIYNALSSTTISSKLLTWQVTHMTYYPLGNYQLWILIKMP